MGGELPTGRGRQAYIRGDNDAVSARLTGLGGPVAGQIHDLTRPRVRVGSHPTNDVVVRDLSASRFHCEIDLGGALPSIFDLRSRDGTFVDGVRIREAMLREGSLIRIGQSTLRIDFGVRAEEIPLWPDDRFGPLVGRSVAMRSVFAFLDSAARSDATVLLEGETGTGKERAAEVIHARSARAGNPLRVVDCSTISPNLLESELFGHERGAFTGAVDRHVGVFEDADGGTVFLDEVGELPLELQPKLLRVLEGRQLRRVGSTEYRPLDVRVIAATNRELRAEVGARRFRSDLYYRLAVLKIQIPPLRNRPEDIPLIAREILIGLDPKLANREVFKSSNFLDRLRAGAWPGNVRELRNYLERCLSVGRALPVSDLVEGRRLFEFDTTGSYQDARQRVLDEFEARYLRRLLERHRGRVAEAARAARLNRRYLYRLLKKAGIDPDEIRARLRR